MKARYALGLLSLAIGLMASAPADARAQTPAQPKDDALDSLLEKISSPPGATGAKSENPAKSKTAKPDKPAKSQEKAPRKDEAAKGSDPKAKAKGQAGESTGTSGSRRGSPVGETGREGRRGQAGRLCHRRRQGQGSRRPARETRRDQDTPTPDEHPRGGPGAPPERQGQRPSRPGQTGRNTPTGKDKDIDEHLEELTGRRKKRNADDGQRPGKVGEIIKEMRDVEQKLGKPDTGEGTRDQQKKIVKNIDTLIEEVKRSGASMKGLVFRRSRRPGQQQGRQQGQTEGTMARGAPLSRPKQPTGKHSNAGGKDIWGHLPPELRQEIENQTNEESLSAKEDLIDRYYLSVNKGKLVREE